MADLTKELRIIISSFADLKAFHQLGKAISSTTNIMKGGMVQVGKLKNDITALGGEVSKSGKSFKFAGDKGWQPMIKSSKLVDKNVQMVSARMTAFNKEIDSTFKSVMTGTRSAIPQLVGGFKSIGNVMLDTGAGAASAKRTFSMHFLGMMFFGMQLQRMFQTLMVSATQTFMKLSEGAGSAGMAVSALAANWTLVKFAIGNALAIALEPLIPAITRLAVIITDFISKNPQKLGWALASIVTLGGVLFFGSQLALFIEALRNFFVAMKTGEYISYTNKLGKALKGIGSVLISVLFAKETFDDLAEGKWVSALSNALLTGALVSSFFTKSKLPGVLAAFGIGAMIADTIPEIDATTFSSNLFTALEAGIGYGFVTRSLKKGVFATIIVGVVLEFLRGREQITETGEGIVDQAIKTHKDNLDEINKLVSVGDIGGFSGALRKLGSGLGLGLKTATGFAVGGLGTVLEMIVNIGKSIKDSFIGPSEKAKKAAEDWDDVLIKQSLVPSMKALNIELSESVNTIGDTTIGLIKGFSDVFNSTVLLNQVIPTLVELNEEETLTWDKKARAIERAARAQEKFNSAARQRLETRRDFDEYKARSSSATI